MALPKKNRITERADIQAVFQRGRTVKSSFFFLRVLPAGKRETRFAFVVPAGIVRGAAERNRIRRRFSEIARQILPILVPSRDIVVVCTKGCGDEPQAAERALADTLRELRLRYGDTKI